MSKLRVLAATLAMVLVVSVPAAAQSLSVSNSGDYAEQCVASQQSSNEGDIENSVESQQQYSASDDFESGGTTLSFGPELENACDQSVEQASSASS